MSDYTTQTYLSNKPSPKRKKVYTRPSDLTLKPKDTGCVVNNTGASGAITVTLPAGARIGDCFEIMVNAAQEIRVDPGLSTDSIVLTGLSPSAGEYVTANAAGEYATFTYIGNSTWFASNIGGTWTEETP